MLKLLNRGKLKKKSIQIKKEVKEERERESVRFCVMFTLKPANEFKMASGLCQEPQHQRVRQPVKSQYFN